MRVKAVALYLLPLTQAYKFCITESGPRSRKNIPTILVTSTSKATETTFFEPDTTVISTTTIITVIGKTTTTVPAGPNFTKIVDAPTSTTVYTNFYPTKVRCTSVTTIYKRNASTVTATPYFISSSFTTLTSRVPTSTAYAACATDPRPHASDRNGNVIEKFHGDRITYQYTDGDNYVLSPYETDYKIAALSGVTCCEFAQRRNFTGFSWYYDDDGYRGCSLFEMEWLFGTHDFGRDSYQPRDSRYGSGGRSGKVTFLEFIPPP